MTVQAAIQFNHASADTPPPIGSHVTFAIRTDALHATDRLIAGLADLTEIKSRDINASTAVKNAYKVWGEEVLTAFARNLDYRQYGFNDETRNLNVQFYPARDLSKKTIANAHAMAPASQKPFLISLDDMIGRNGDADGSIAFSRLFSLDGKTEMDYVERPGHAPISVQLARIAEQLKDIQAANGGDRVPLILLEDNVRRAKMLNWVIDLMDKHGIFKHGELAGISTSFCNASAEERSKITCEGKPVPVKAVVDCDTRCVVDVATTRDLLFDGFVTEFQGTVGRLPGIFMDVVSRFKIAPTHADTFRREVIDANMRFCRAMETEFGVNPPLEWFDGGEIIAKIMNCPMHTPMTEILARTAHGIGLKRTGNDNRMATTAARAAVGGSCAPV